MTVDATTSGALEVKAPTATEQAKAAAQVEAARIDCARRKWLEAVTRFEAEEDCAIASTEAPPVVAVAQEGARWEGAEATLATLARATLFEKMDAYAVGAALQHIIDDEDEAERIRRLYEAMRERAERRAKRSERVLMPIIEEWCRSNPPPPTKAGKPGSTWRFPSTGAKLVHKDADGKIEVVNERKAVEAIQRVLGLDAFQALTVETSVKTGEARKMLEERGINPATLAGINFRPAGKVFQIHRGKGAEA